MIATRTRIVRNRFGELSRQGRQAAARWNLRHAETAAAAAHGLVPKLSGDLDSTIRAVPNKRTGSASLVAGGTARSGREVDYADDVEYGTIHAAAQPYVTPAIESTKKKMGRSPVRIYKG